jgi:hypothetical protein
MYYLTSPPLARDWLTRLQFNMLNLSQPGAKRTLKRYIHEFEANMFLYYHDR